MLDRLEDESDLVTKIDMQKRHHLGEIPAEILRQQWFLEQGNIHYAYKRFRAAARCFTQCLKTGHIYDPRVRKECLERLQGIFRERGLEKQTPNVGKMLEVFKHRNKDVVFLVEAEA